MECLVYWTSWLLCCPQGALTLRWSRAKRWRLSSAENTDLHTSCGNMPTENTKPSVRALGFNQRRQKMNTGCDDSDNTPEVELLLLCIFSCQVGLLVTLTHSSRHQVFHCYYFCQLLEQKCKRLSLTLELLLNH